MPANRQQDSPLPVQIGQKVPDLRAKAYQAGVFKDVRLADHKGKWLVLFFYPRDFTFICPTEITGFSDKEAEFKKRNAVVLGASTDSEFSHKAWFERDLPNVKFPVVADTTHAWARTFGVLKEDEGLAYRGTFIIDPTLALRWVSISDTGVGRSIEETLRILAALQTGELCPVEWKPGMKTLGK